MKSRTGSLLLWSGALLVLAAALLLVSTPAAAALPEDTCTLDGSTRTCHLYATTGTVTMPDGVVVPIWGFADTAGISATLPGPTLIGHQGETMEVVLHNNLLAETIALEFPGQLLSADLTGVPAGGVVTYTFPLTAGTFLYEAGLTPNGPRQVAMGLYGALIVRSPNPGWAYNDPISAYTAEELLVLSEIDPALNNDPAGFLLHEYAPRYFLINGQSYPDVPEIPVVAGDRLLLRFVNAGLKTHSMGVLDRYQTMIANDGFIRNQTHRSQVEMVASGQTMDSLIGITAPAEQDQRTLLYDSNLLLHNASQRLASGQLAYGGMMTFIRVTSGTPPSGAGPVVSNVQIVPNPTTGAAGVTLSADVTSATPLTTVEYFTNTLGVAGSGGAMAVSGGPGTYQATATVAPEVLAGWPSGFVTFYVHGSVSGPSGTVWGPVASGVLNLDKQGPETHGLSLWPEPTNGSRPVLLRATGDDHTTGGNNVVAGEYFVGPVGLPGTGTPMSVWRIDNPVTAMTATLPLPIVQALPEGLHPINVSSQDSLGNWGIPGIVTLTLDLTGPDATVLTLTPSTLDLTGAPPVVSVRLEGMVTDAHSRVANAEGFVDVEGLPGTGFDLFPSDGLFDEASEAVYFDIPVAAFLLLSQGPHPVYVHGLDAAGNWGPVASTDITIERGLVDVVGLDLTSPLAEPNPTNGAASVALRVDAADAVSNIGGGQWYISRGYIGTLQAADGAFDTSAEVLAASVDVTGWPNGTHVLNLLGYDAGYNRGPVAQIVLTVAGNNPVQIMADGFESSDLTAWDGVVGNVSVAAGAQLSADAGSLGVAATIDGGAAAYVSHAMPAGEKTLRARFLFDPNSANLGSVPANILAGVYGEKAIMGIQVRGSSAGGYDVRGWTLSNGVPMYTDWTSISDEAHSLGIQWRAARQATFSLSVDGRVVGSLDWLDTAVYTVHQLWLGPSGDIDPAATGAVYLDSFDARRNMALFLPTIVRGK